MSGVSSEPPSQEVTEAETEVTLHPRKKLPLPIVVIDDRSGEESQESEDVVFVEKSEQISTDSWASAKEDDDHSLTSGSLR